MVTDIILYVIVFMLLQFFTLIALVTCSALVSGQTIGEAFHQAFSNDGLSAQMQAAISALSGLIIALVFIKARWSPVSRNWLSGHPWGVLCWVALLAVGSLIPFQWAEDQLNLKMPDNFVQLFTQLMQEPLGYIAVGVMAPVAEELVFRGAILRTLLRLFSPRAAWVSIVISSIIFGAIHGNLPQFVHASLLGIILGWMYYRSRSVVPGIVFHWVNNTIAYILANLMPQAADGQLIDLFQGNHRTMYMAIAFSLCIFIPALLQINSRLKKAS